MGQLIRFTAPSAAYPATATLLDEAEGTLLTLPAEDIANAPNGGSRVALQNLKKKRLISAKPRDTAP